MSTDKERVFTGNKLLQYYAVTLLATGQNVLIYADCEEDVWGAILAHNSAHNAQIYVVVDSIELANQLSQVGMHPIYVEDVKTCDTVPGVYDLVVNRHKGADSYVLITADPDYRESFPNTKHVRIKHVFPVDDALIVSGDCEVVDED